MPIIKVTDTRGKVRYMLKIEPPLINDGLKPRVDVLNKKEFHKVLKKK